MKTPSSSVALLAFCALSSAHSLAVVYDDNFDISQGAGYTTSGNIGTSEWQVQRSGDDWGARIDSGVMLLNNTISATPNLNGWVYSFRELNPSGDFSTMFNESAGLMTWTLNMQQIRTNPAGFSSGSYGVAYILGSSSSSVATSGVGYAVVLGNTSSPDPLRLVSFTNGIQSLGTASSGVIVATSPLDNPTNNYMSIRVTFDPLTGEWEMFGRNDGLTGFSDPNTGTLSSLGSGIDTLYTGNTLSYSGAYWQGSTAPAQTAQFDNVSLQVVPEPSVYALLALASALFLVSVGRRHFRCP
jgi:hypothetical protein